MRKWTEARLFALARPMPYAPKYRCTKGVSQVHPSDWTAAAHRQQRCSAAIVADNRSPLPQSLALEYGAKARALGCLQARCWPHSQTPLHLERVVSRHAITAGHPASCLHERADQRLSFAHFGRINSGRRRSRSRRCRADTLFRSQNKPRGACATG
ncbi:MAG: hypothetical protein ACI8W7_004796 [Gammaproteobacteria bacterium]